jgi:hypothetical protein
MVKVGFMTRRDNLIRVVVMALVVSGCSIRNLARCATKQERYLPNKERLSLASFHSCGGRVDWNETVPTVQKNL